MSLASVAALLIRLYQKYISPRKGFRCAHRVLHGGPSCSEFARLYVQQHSVWAMFPALRARFRECRMAKETLAADGVVGTQNTKKDPTPLWCDLCGGVADAGTCCGTGTADAASGCDAGPVNACECPCGGC